jgi:hypothetical protein
LRTAGCAASPQVTAVMRCRPSALSVEEASDEGATADMKYAGKP